MDKGEGCDLGQEIRVQGLGGGMVTGVGVQRIWTTWGRRLQRPEGWREGGWRARGRLWPAGTYWMAPGQQPSRFLSQALCLPGSRKLLRAACSRGPTCTYLKAVSLREGGRVANGSCKIVIEAGIAPEAYPHPHPPGLAASRDAHDPSVSFFEQVQGVEQAGKLAEAPTGPWTRSGCLTGRI